MTRIAREGDAPDFAFGEVEKAALRRGFWVLRVFGVTLG